MWQQSADTDDDIYSDGKLIYDAAQTYCEELARTKFTDWRLTVIKLLYSFVEFRGTTHSWYEVTDT